MYRSSTEQVRGDELWSGHASPQVLPLDYTRIDEFLCFLHSVPRHASHYNVVPLSPLPGIAQQDYARGEQRVVKVTRPSVPELSHRYPSVGFVSTVYRKQAAVRRDSMSAGVSEQRRTWQRGPPESDRVRSP